MAVTLNSSGITFSDSNSQNSASSPINMGNNVEYNNPATINKPAAGLGIFVAATGGGGGAGQFQTNLGGPGGDGGAITGFIPGNDGGASWSVTIGAGGYYPPWNSRGGNKGGSGTAGGATNIDGFLVANGGGGGSNGGNGGNPGSTGNGQTNRPMGIGGTPSTIGIGGGGKGRASNNTGDISANQGTAGKANISILGA